MIDHTGIVVRDIARSRRFYQAVAGALGLGLVDRGRDAFMVGRLPGDAAPYLWIGKASPPGAHMHPGDRGCQIAFRAEGRAAVEAFRRRAAAAGGTAAGTFRSIQGNMACYAARMVDPDGNTIEARALSPAAL